MERIPWGAEVRRPQFSVINSLGPSPPTRTVIPSMRTPKAGIQFCRKVNARVATAKVVSRRGLFPKEFRQRLEYMHLNPVRKGLVARPECRCWSNYNNFDPSQRAACPIQVDSIWLPEGYRA